MLGNNKQIVVVFAQPVAVGQEFQKWPLHITLTPWFSAAQPLNSKLSNIAQATDSFAITTGAAKKFGKTPVILINQSSQLDSLHRQLVTELQQQKAVLQWTDRILEDFNPHISQRSGQTFKPGQKLKIASFYLVEAQDQPGSQRRVAREFKLL